MTGHCYSGVGCRSRMHVPCMRSVDLEKDPWDADEARKRKKRGHSMKDQDQDDKELCWQL